MKCTNIQTDILPVIVSTNIIINVESWDIVIIFLDLAILCSCILCNVYYICKR